MITSLTNIGRTVGLNLFGSKGRSLAEYFGNAVGRVAVFSCKPSGCWLEVGVDVFPVEAVAADAPVDIGEDNLELMEIVSIVEASFTFGSVIVSFAIVNEETIVAVTVEVFRLELNDGTGTIFFLCDSDDVRVGRIDAVGPVVLE